MLGVLNPLVLGMKTENELMKAQVKLNGIYV